MMIISICTFLALSPSRNVFMPLTSHTSGTYASPVRNHRYTDSSFSQPFVQKHGAHILSRSTACNLKATPKDLHFSLEAVGSMSLLALQFGVQPSLTRKFTGKTINRSTVVFVQDVVKFIMAGIALFVTGAWNSAIVGWNVKTWLRVAGIPAVLYCIQNYATLIAYQNLSPLTFNVLNQTKTMSAALCCYLLMGKVQSKLQILSLFILFGSACIIEKIIPLDFVKAFRANRSRTDDNVVKSRNDEANNNEGDRVALNGKETDNHFQGVLAVLLASFLSGLAGALTQKNLQGGSGSITSGRNSYFFTMELCVVSLFFTAMSMIQSQDGAKIRENGFFHGWTPKTLIPIATNAAGGIVVGLVTKYAGSVKKGFALIFGLVLSGVLQAFMEEDNGNKQGSKISKEHIAGGILAAFSLWMHSAFPVMASVKMT